MEIEKATERVDFYKQLVDQLVGFVPLLRPPYRAAARAPVRAIRLRHTRDIAAPSGPTKEQPPRQGRQTTRKASSAPRESTTGIGGRR